MDARIKVADGPGGSLYRQGKNLVIWDVIGRGFTPTRSPAGHIAWPFTHYDSLKIDSRVFHPTHREFDRAIRAGERYTNDRHADPPTLRFPEFVQTWRGPLIEDLHPPILWGYDWGRDGSWTPYGNLIYKITQKEPSREHVLQLRDELRNWVPPRVFVEPLLHHVNATLNKNRLRTEFATRYGAAADAGASDDTGQKSRLSAAGALFAAISEAFDEAAAKYAKSFAERRLPV